jgi:hypothetical protein
MVIKVAYPYEDKKDTIAAPRGATARRTLDSSAPLPPLNQQPTASRKASLESPEELNQALTSSTSLNASSVNNYCEFSNSRME